jgi:hypothetical protein
VSKLKFSYQNSHQSSKKKLAESGTSSKSDLFKLLIE